MRAWLNMVTLCVAGMLAMPAVAALTVSSSLVKSGFFQAPDCTPEADPKAYNECVCHANIKKAQISGLTPELNKAVNEALAMLPEKLAAESCEGEATKSPQDGLKVNLASADYEVAYQTDATLTVLVTYSTYGAGAEHPLEGTEGFTFDLVTGRLVDPIAHLKPEEVKKADGFVKQELLKKYPTALYDEAKTRTDPYLTENGCDTCTLFYGKDGWMVRFQLAAIAPYMTGEPEVVLPADIIPSPDKLLLKN
jgi:hypothetical protein